MLFLSRPKEVRVLCFLLTKKHRSDNLQIEDGGQHEKELAAANNCNCNTRCRCSHRCNSGIRSDCCCSGDFSLTLQTEMVSKIHQQPVQLIILLEPSGLLKGDPK
jgi:hypothetical protein